MAKLRKKHEDAEPVPMAPMIDMVFLLLVFFMTVSTVASSNKTIPLELPESITAPVPEDMSGRGVVSIDAEGECYVGGKLIVFDDLKSKVESWLKSNNELKLQVRADKNAQFVHIKKVLKACAELGVYDIVYSTYQDQ